MVLYTRFRKASLFFSTISLLLLMLLFSGCGGSTGSQTQTGGNTPTSTAPTTGITPTVPAATATAQAMTQMMTVVGQPTAKMLGGTTFEITGQLKNGDTNQHDITIQGALLDGSGKVIAEATKMLDNVKGGQTVAFTIQGNTPQATWSSIQVTVIKVSENIDGTGGD